MGRDHTFVDRESRFFDYDPDERQRVEIRDFFISYTQSDKSWAQWVAWYLEKAGYSTIIQAWDFKPGTNFVLKMQEALTNSKRTLIILSREYLQSSFAQPEWAAVFAQNPTSDARQLIPIRVGECELSGLLKSIVYIDLVGAKSDRAAAILLDGISRERSKPLSAPPFPCDTDHEQGNIPGKSLKRSIKRLSKKHDLETYTYQTTSIHGKEIIRHALSDEMKGQHFIQSDLDLLVKHNISLSRHISIIMLDIDSLTAINKRFSSVVGDEVIHIVAGLLSKFGSNFYTGRCGDDTFYMLAEGMNAFETIPLAKTIINNIRQYQWYKVAAGLWVTCSAGVAQFDKNERAEETGVRASIGFQLAKHQGGNRVLLGPNHLPSTPAPPRGNGSDGKSEIFSCFSHEEFHLPW